MKVELDDNSGTTITICAVALIIAMISMYGCHQRESTIRAGYAAGLQDMPTPGTTTTHLGKP